MTTEMPKVKLPRIVRFLQSTGCLRVCVTGFECSTNEFIYSTQFRWWHPLGWIVSIGTACVGFIDYLRLSYRVMEWRAHNG